MPVVEPNRPRWAAAGWLATRVAQVVLRLAYGFLAAAGAFVAPGRSLVWGAGWAMAAGVAVALLPRRAAAGLPPLPHPAVVATAAGCLPAAVAGATVLGAAAGPVLGALMTLAAVLTGRWLSADLPPAGGATPWDEDAVRRGLRDLPTDLLLDEWRSTGRPGAGGAAADLRRVRLRALLIDEFQARDPAGTTRWLTEGPGDPPDRYIGRGTALGR